MTTVFLCLLVQRILLSGRREMIIFNVNSKLVQAGDCSVLDRRQRHGQSCSIGHIQNEASDRRENASDGLLRVMFAQMTDDRFAAVHLVTDDVLIGGLFSGELIGGRGARACEQRAKHDTHAVVDIESNALRRVGHGIVEGDAPRFEGDCFTIGCAEGDFHAEGAVWRMDEQMLNIAETFLCVHGYFGNVFD